MELSPGHHSMNVEKVLVQIQWEGRVGCVDKKGERETFGGKHPGKPLDLSVLLT